MIYTPIVFCPSTMKAVDRFGGKMDAKVAEVPHPYYVLIFKGLVLYAPPGTDMQTAEVRMRYLLSWRKTFQP